MTILSHFPAGQVPRELQTEVLEILERNWKSHDVFIINAPVAAGKSSIASAIASWSGKAAILVPTNVLVSQYIESGLDIAHVQASSQYSCDLWGTCASAPMYKGKKAYCKGVCQYSKDYREACSSPRTLSTAHMYLALRRKSPTLIFDEGHNLVKIIQDMGGKQVWPHKAGIPFECLGSHARLLDWAVTETSPIANLLEEQLLTDKPEYVIQFTQDYWSGGGHAWGEKLVRGEATLLPQIRLIPTNLRQVKHSFWDQAPWQKLIFLSATISRKDMEEVGLDSRRVLYLESKSPIPKENRPFIPDYVGSINWRNIAEMTPKVAEYILRFADSRRGKKGFIHTTYAMAERLREYLSGNSRFLFHDKLTTSQTLATFRREKTDAVMVASGLYEGVSLDYDLARWQIITKCPWPSQADPAIAHRLARDPEYYAWETIKPILQASGRVCRRPDDFGETVCLDSSFERLRRDWDYMFPMWFSESITEGRRLV